MHTACMAVNISIRHVPEEVRDVLAQRAAQNGQSMQEYLLTELVRIAERPSLGEWVDRVRDRKAATESELPANEIVAQVRSGRR